MSADLRARYFVVRASEGRRRLVRVASRMRARRGFVLLGRTQWTCEEVVAGGNRIRTPFVLADDVLRNAADEIEARDDFEAHALFAAAESRRRSEAGR